MTSESMGRIERTVNASAYPRVDPEFAALLPPLTRDQKLGLEKLILSTGRITSPLAVWAEEGLLIDGHHRREIALRHGLDFRTEEMSFPTREAVIEWMFANQRDRRNLTPDQLALVMGRHYNRTKAAPNSRPGNDNTKRGHQKVDREFRGTDDRLAKEYGVSDMTIQRAGKFAAAVETLRAVDPDIETKVVTGKGPTRKAVISAAAKVEEDPAGALAILTGEEKLAPRGRYPSEPKETLADKRGFKNLPNRALADKVAASLLAMETHIEFLETVNPERLNGEREPLTERLCKAARLLNRTRTAWTGDKK